VGHTGFLTTARLLLPFDDPRIPDDPGAPSGHPRVLDDTQDAFDDPQSDDPQDVASEP
jgi:hypothetical protein